ncbi:MAG: Holliday junction branch migration protein RuvA [Anaerolineales bacterium]|nr:Holliday junction branch migration protein RuvA [Anaerolineales bacterium]
MIATLHGKIQARTDDSLIVNVGGVGFRVRVPTGTLANLGAVGSEAQLFTHLHVREDDLSLYGFATEDELRLFETLLTVSGIGPKVGMGILSAAPVDLLRAAIAQGNLDVLTALPGIGKKTAQRLVLELKGKVDLRGLGEVSELTPIDKDVMDALINLGYSAAEAARAARSVPSTVQAIEERVRVALQYLGGR